VVYGCWGGGLPKQDSFCISPGHVSPPSPSQTHQPKTVSVHAKEPCGLWAAFSRLGWAGNQQEDQIRAAGRDKMTSRYIWAPAQGCRVGARARGGVSLPGGGQGVSPLPPVSGGPGQPLVPMAVQVTVLGTGSGDEVTFPDSAGIWAGQELQCVSCPGPPGMGDFLCIP